MTLIDKFKILLKGNAINPIEKRYLDAPYKKKCSFGHCISYYSPIDCNGCYYQNMGSTIDKINRWGDNSLIRAFGLLAIGIIGWALLGLGINILTGM